jgi:hypothetical protein
MICKSTRWLTEPLLAFCARLGNPCGGSITNASRSESTTCILARTASSLHRGQQD